MANGFTPLTSSDELKREVFDFSQNVLNSQRATPTPKTPSIPAPQVEPQVQQSFLDAEYELPDGTRASYLDLVRSGGQSTEIVEYQKLQERTRLENAFAEKAALEADTTLTQDIKDLGKNFLGGFVVGSNRLGKSLVGTSRVFTGALLGDDEMVQRGKASEQEFDRNIEFLERSNPDFFNNERGRSTDSLSNDLTNPFWYARQIGETSPSLVTSIAPSLGAARVGIAVNRLAAGGAAKAAQAIAASPVDELVTAAGQSMTVGEVVNAAPLISNVALRRIAATAGGSAGGTLEGLASFREVLENGGTSEEAIRVGFAQALATGGLNALSLNVFLRGMDDTIKSHFLTRFLQSGTTESVTEAAEEFTNFAFEMGLVSSVESQKTLGAVIDAAVRVGGPSFLIGGFLGAGAGSPNPQEEVEAEVEEENQDATTVNPVIDFLGDRSNRIHFFGGLNSLNADRVVDTGTGLLLKGRAGEEDLQVPYSRVRSVTRRVAGGAGETLYESDPDTNPEAQKEAFEAATRRFNAPGRRRAQAEADAETIRKGLEEDRKAEKEIEANLLEELQVGRLVGTRESASPTLTEIANNLPEGVGGVEGFLGLLEAEPTRDAQTAAARLEESQFLFESLEILRREEEAFLQQENRTREEQGLQSLQPSQRLQGLHNRAQKVFAEAERGAASFGLRRQGASVPELTAADAEAAKAKKDAEAKEVEDERQLRDFRRTELNLRLKSRDKFYQGIIRGFNFPSVVEGAINLSSDLLTEFVLDYTDGVKSVRRFLSSVRRKNTEDKAAQQQRLNTLQSQLTQIQDVERTTLASINAERATQNAEPEAQSSTLAGLIENVKKLREDIQKEIEDASQEGEQPGSGEPERAEAPRRRQAKGPGRGRGPRRGKKGAEAPAQAEAKKTPPKVKRKTRRQKVAEAVENAQGETATATIGEQNNAKRQRLQDSASNRPNRENGGQERLEAEVVQGIALAGEEEALTFSLGDVPADFKTGKGNLRRTDELRQRVADALGVTVDEAKRLISPRNPNRLSDKRVFALAYPEVVSDILSIDPTTKPALPSLGTAARERTELLREEELIARDIAAARGEGDTSLLRERLAAIQEEVRNLERRFPTLAALPKPVTTIVKGIGAVTPNEVAEGRSGPSTLFEVRPKKNPSASDAHEQRVQSFLAEVGDDFLSQDHELAKARGEKSLVEMFLEDEISAQELTAWSMMERGLIAPAAEGGRIVDAEGNVFWEAIGEEGGKATNIEIHGIAQVYNDRVGVAERGYATVHNLYGDPERVSFKELEEMGQVEFDKRMEGSLRRGWLGEFKEALLDAVEASGGAVALNNQQLDFILRMTFARGEAHAAVHGITSEEWFKKRFFRGTGDAINHAFVGEVKAFIYHPTGKVPSLKKRVETEAPLDPQPARKGEDIAGVTEFSDSHAALITLTRNADAQTVVHELLHVFREDLALDSDIEAVVGFINEKVPGSIRKTPEGKYIWSSDGEEAFVDTAMQFMTQGSRSMPENVRGVFGKIKSWFSVMYKKFFRYQNLPTEVEDAFNRMFFVPIKPNGRAKMVGTRIKTKSGQFDVNPAYLAMSREGLEGWLNVIDVERTKEVRTDEEAEAMAESLRDELGDDGVLEQYDSILAQGGVPGQLLEMATRQIMNDRMAITMKKASRANSDAEANAIIEAERESWRRVEEAGTEAGRTLRSRQRTTLLTQAADALTELSNSMSKRERNRLFEAINEVVQDPGSLEKHKNLEAILRAQTDTPQLWDYAMVIAYNGMLSNPATHGLNTTMNTTWQLWLGVPEKAVAAGIDRVMSGLTGRSREVYLSEIGPFLFKALRERPIRSRIWTGMKDIMLSGREPNDPAYSKLDTDISFKQQFAFEHSPDTIQIFGKDLNSGGFLRKMAPYVNMFTRGLKAMDYAAFTIAYEGHMHALAVRKVRQAIDRGEVKRGNFKREVDRMMAKPSRELQHEAGLIARNATFTDEPGKLTRSILNVRKRTGPAGVIVIPFVNTIANLTKRSLEFVPGVGFVVPAMQRNDTKEGVSPDQFIPKLSQTLAKQLTGAVAAYSLISAFGDDGEDGLPLMTADLPRSKSEREFWARNGILPYSVRIGNTYVSFERIAPFSMILAGAATAVEKAKEYEEDQLNPEKEASATQAFMDFANAMTGFMIDESYLSSTSRLFDRSDSIAEEIAQRTTSFIPFNGMLRFIAEHTDEFEGGVPIREGNTVLKQLIKVTPFSRHIYGELEKDTPVRVDAFGEPLIYRKNSFFLSWLPVRMSKEVRLDPVEAELTRSGYYPGVPFPDKLMTVFEGKPRYEIPQDLYDQYASVLGVKGKEALAQEIGRSRYVRLGDDFEGTTKKHRLLVQAFDKVRDREKRKLLREMKKRVRSGEIRLKTQDGPAVATLNRKDFNAF